MAKIKVSKGQPEVKPMTRNNTPLDDTADIRDDISYLVGGGYKSLSDQDSRGSFARLASVMGTDKAQKLMDAISIHAQRPEVLKMSPEQRLSSFYSIGSSSPDIAPYIQRAKSFGSGVLAGFRDSPLLVNKYLSGQEQPLAVADVNEKIIPKVMVKVPK